MSYIIIILNHIFVKYCVVLHIVIFTGQGTRGRISTNNYICNLLQRKASIGGVNISGKRPFTEPVC